MKARLYVRRRCKCVHTYIACSVRVFLGCTDSIPHVMGGEQPATDTTRRKTRRGQLGSSTFPFPARVLKSCSLVAFSSLSEGLDVFLPLHWVREGRSLLRDTLVCFVMVSVWICLDLLVHVPRLRRRGVWMGLQASSHQPRRKLPRQVLPGRNPPLNKRRILAPHQGAHALRRPVPIYPFVDRQMDRQAYVCVCTYVRMRTRSVRT